MMFSMHIIHVNSQNILTRFSYKQFFFWKLGRSTAFNFLHFTAFLMKKNDTAHLERDQFCTFIASSFIHFIALTHISLASHFWDIGKQCRPRSDATERGV